jgi:hypothetical protein
MLKPNRISELVARTNRLNVIIGVAISLLFLFSSVALAQILYGALTGNVSDPTGALLPKARVEALNVATGVVRSTDVDSSGVYYFAELQPGMYRVTVSAAGFVKTSVENVQVEVNGLRRVNVQLKVAAATQEVTVNGAAPLLETDRADVHTNIDAREIQNLPISSSQGRSWQSLYNLVPGATPTGEANSLGGNPQRAMNTNVNGGSNQGNNTRIDGVQDAYPWLPANIAYVPPADAIETVNVVTNSFDAEQGMAGGMAANVQIKSGTNRFHGSVHEFHTDEALRAENYFQPQSVFSPVLQQNVPFRKPKNIQNQFGYTFGGPIKKDKLFFFTDFERTTQRQFATRLLTVPTDAMRAGNFAGLTDAKGNPVNIYDPGSPGAQANGTGRSIFSFGGIPNVIDPARFDPAAVTMMKLIPEPNLPISNPGNPVNDYLATGDAPFNRNDIDAKINYVPSDKSMIFGRYSISWHSIFDPPDLGPAGGDATNGGQNGNADGRIQVVGLGGSYSLSPNMLVDANFGYTRQRLDAKDTDIGSNFGLNTLNIPGTNGPSPLQGGIPSFQISSFANLGNANTGNPFLFRDNQYVSNANLSWNQGRHGMRFGIEWNRTGLNHFQPQGGTFQTARGTLGFTGNVTTLSGGLPADMFNSWAQFLLGLPTQVGKATQNVNPNSLRWSQWALYARDQWQLLPRLTFTYGLRWERYPFLTSDHGGARLLDPTTMNVLIGGNGGVPLDDGVKIGIGEFLPRVGLAWRALEHTVIRAGYGISADPNNWRFFRNTYPAVTNSIFTGFGGFNLAPASSLDAANPNANLGPYAGLPLGIPAIPAPTITSGVVPLPDAISSLTVPNNFRRGYTHSFNLTVGQEFAGFVTEIGYVGSRSIRPLANININPSPIGGGADGKGQDGRLLNVAFGHLSTVINPATGKAYAGWGDLNQELPFGNAYYDSLQARLMRRFKGNSLLGVSYTFSKAIDFTDDEELNFVLFPFPAYVPKAKGLASFDRPQNLRIYGTYDLPFGGGQRWAQTGILSHILGGWQANGILSFVSGVPLTITASNNPFFSNTGVTETAQLTGSLNILNNTPRPGCPAKDLSCHYFDPSVFSDPNAPIFGNTGRDFLRGPGFFNLDMSLFRNFKLKEGLTLQARGEAFGLTNTPRFNNPGTNADGTNFGVITGSSGERTVWVAAKLIF